jgi:hypothetical protein
VEAIEDAGHSMDRFILRPEGWLSEFELGIRATIDREESKKLSVRMLDVRAREARDGKPRPGLCRGYGYTYDKQRKAFEVVDSEAETVRECAQGALAGESIYSIVKDLNRRGVATVGSGPWSTNVMLSILRSPRIAGLRTHLGQVVAKGQWEPLISVEEHERLIVVTANRHGHGPKKAPRTYPLVGFLRCGRCGQSLRSVTRQGGGRRYACRKGENLGGCGSIMIKAEFVEDAVQNYVVAALTDPITIARLHASAPEPTNRVHEDLLAELRRLDLARQRLTDLAMESAIAPAEVRRKNDELDASTEAVKHKLADVPAMSALADLPTTLEEMAAAWDDRGIDYQRSLITLTIESITINSATRMAPGRFDESRLVWTMRG